MIEEHESCLMHNSTLNLRIRIRLTCSTWNGSLRQKPTFLVLVATTSCPLEIRSYKSNDSTRVLCAPRIASSSSVSSSIVRCLRVDISIMVMGHVSDIMEYDRRT